MQGRHQLFSLKKPCAHDPQALQREEVQVRQLGEQGRQSEPENLKTWETRDVQGAERASLRRRNIILIMKGKQTGTLSQLWRSEYYNSQQAQIKLASFKKNYFISDLSPKRTLLSSQNSRKGRLSESKFYTLNPKSSQIRRQHQMKIATDQKKLRVLKSAERLAKKLHISPPQSVQGKQYHQIRFMVDSNINSISLGFQQISAKSQYKSINQWLNMMTRTPQQLFINFYDHILNVLSDAGLPLNFKIAAQIFQPCLTIIQNALSAQHPPFVHKLILLLRQSRQQIQAANMLEGVGVKNLLNFIEKIRSNLQGDIYMHKILQRLRECLPKEQMTSMLMVVFFKQDIPKIKQLIESFEISLTELQYFLLKYKLWIQLPKLGINNYLTNRILSVLEQVKESFSRCSMLEEVLFVRQRKGNIKKQVCVQFDKNYTNFERVKAIKSKNKFFKIEPIVQLLLSSILEKDLHSFRHPLSLLTDLRIPVQRLVVSDLMTQIQSELLKLYMQKETLIFIKSMAMKIRWNLGLQRNAWRDLTSKNQKYSKQILISMEQFFLKEKKYCQFTNEFPEEKINLLYRTDNNQGGLQLLEILLVNYYSLEMILHPLSFRVGIDHKLIKPIILEFWLEALLLLGRSKPEFKIIRQDLKSFFVQMEMIDKSFIKCPSNIC